jgi:hypothetical protein
MHFGSLQISSGAEMESLSAKLDHITREGVRYDAKRSGRSDICDV